MDGCAVWCVLCSVVWREVLLPFSVLTVSLWLFVSLFVSRFRWDCTAGCSEHSREAPNTFGFGIAAGCSEHSREAPNAFGFGRRRLFRAQPGAPNAFGFGHRRLFRAQPGAPNALGFGRRRLFVRERRLQRSLCGHLTVDSWHVAPLVSRVQTVPASRHRAQGPGRTTKEHTVACAPNFAVDSSGSGPQTLSSPSRSRASSPSLVTVCAVPQRADQPSLRAAGHGSVSRGVTGSHRQQSAAISSYQQQSAFNHS